MIGRSLSHYIILEELGRGGMGVVYKAEDTKLGRMVALKVLPGHLTADNDARVRFEQEAIAASTLEHPNICTIHHVGETEGGEFYIVMPCYEGQTLSDRIRSGPVDVDEAVSIGRQILSGLQKAHDAGIVHRDIKPANVMLVDGRAILMDFGLAKLAGGEDVTKTGSTVGSLAYMSPEQARGEDLDSRSDLWSVGVLLYEMLAGQRPFQAPYPEAHLYAVLNTDPEAIDVVRVGTPPPVARTIHRLLEKDAKNRYASAREVLKDLDVNLNSSPSIAAVERASIFRLRSVRVAIIAIFVMAIVSFIAFQLSQTGNDASPDVRSLAIFPFSAGSGTEPAFAQEATEQIVEVFKVLADLPVAPISKSTDALAVEVTPREAAVQMGVDMYMTGEVIRRAGSVSIEAFLNETRSDVLLWSEPYTRPESDIRGLYKDVARGAIGTSGLLLSREEERLLSRNRTVSPEANRLLMQGRAARNSDNEAELRRGIEFLERAIEIDSTFAEAYSELANLSVLMVDFGGMSYWPKAVHAATSAIRLDSLAHLAWASLGAYHLYYTWDWDASEESLNKALAIAPQSIEARGTLALLLTSRGRREEARQELQRARQYDAYSYNGRYNSQLVYQFIGDYDRGIEFSRETLEIHPASGITRVMLGTMLALIGDSVGAVAELDKAMPKPGGVAVSPIGALYTAYGMAGYVLAGADDKARALIPEVEKITEKSFFCTYELGLVYVQLGEMDRAFRWLDQAVERHASCVPFMKVDERLDPFRSDPRYQGLLDRVGF